MANDNEYQLTAAYGYGYGLDHWEYRGVSTSNEWKTADDSYGNAAYTVTIDEDREYKAVFEPRFFTVKTAYPTAGVNHSYFSLYGIVTHLSDVSPVTLRIHDEPAELVVEADMPHAILTRAVTLYGYEDYPVLDWRIDVYAGEGTDPKSLLCTRDLTGLPTPVIGGGARVIILAIDSMPYTEKITIVSTTGGEGQAYHVVDTETVDISAYMIEDTLKEERAAAIAELDAARAEARATERYTSSLEVQAIVAKIYSDAVTAINAVEIDEEDGAGLIADQAGAAIVAIGKVIATTTDDELAEIGDVDFGQTMSVVVTAENFTSQEYPPHFIIEPKLMIVPQDTMAMPVILRALEETYPPDELGFKPYKGGGNYLESMYDPAKGGLSGEFTESQTGGWMYSVNGTFPSYGAGVVELHDGDVMRWQSTRDLGNDVRAIAPADGLIKKVAYINRAGNKDDYGDAYTTAMAVLVDRDRTEGQVLAALAALNAKGGPDAVAGLIAAIGTVGTGSGAAIAEARAAYNALTPEQKTAVGNDINTLKDAEAAYAALKPAIEAQALIEAIDGVTPQSGAAIAAARDAYDALSEENKAHVNTAALLAAEAAYEALTQPGGGTGDGTDISGVLAATLARLKATAANPQVGFTNGEWAVLALARGGEMTDQIKNNYLANLRVAIAGAESNQDGKIKIEAAKPTENARVALALSALGIDASGFEGGDLVTPLTDADWVEWQGINGVIFALLALDAKPYFAENTAIREAYVNYLLSEQNGDGGWALSGETSDPDMTAMAIQALAPYAEDGDVQGAVDDGLDALLGMQDGDYGGFYNNLGDYNSEGAAQTVVALTALGTDPTSDGWTVGDSKNPLTALLSFHDGEGRFSHTAGGGYSAMSTEQAAYALVAYERFVNNEPSLYDMSDAIPLEDPAEPNEPIEPTVPTPANPVTSEGVKIADVPFDTPDDSGVQAGRNVTIFSGTYETAETLLERTGLPDDAMDLLSSFVKKDESGALVADPEAVFFGLNSTDASKIDETAEMIPLPVFSAEVDKGKAALATMEMNLDAYAGERIGSLALLKFKPDGTTERLNSAASPEEITHGQYAWTYGSGNAVPPEEVIETGKTYYISVVIEDGSGLDWDSATNGSVVDPLVIAGTNPAYNSESGGGCDTGAGTLTLLALALAMRRRKAA